MLNEAAIEAANSLSPCHWYPCCYEEEGRRLVLEAKNGWRPPIYGTRGHLILREVDYVRCARVSWPESTVLRLISAEETGSLTTPPPAMLLTHDKLVFVAQAGPDEYCIVCREVEFVPWNR